MQYDAVVIGAGPGGYIAAVHLRQLGLKTACIERQEHLGGTCLNIGCIPSKALLHASERFMHFKEDALIHGISIENSDLQLARMVDHKDATVEALTVAVSTLFQKNHVDLIVGSAKIADAHTLVVTKPDGTEVRVSAKAIVLATGSRPIPLPFLPFDEKKVLSSTGALSLKTLPKRMVVVGGGVLGVEMASVYARLGTEVCVVEQLPRICAELDKTLTDRLKQLLEKQNIQFQLNTQVLAAKDLGSKGIELGLRSSSGHERAITTDCVLVAVGRHPNSENLGLSTLKVDMTGRGKVLVDDRFRTAVPSIYAIGDLIEGPNLAHRASYEGRCVAEIIAGKPTRCLYGIIPNVVYTSPEAASVGLTEEAAQELERPLLFGVYHMKANARACISKKTDGIVKVVADRETERILGIHILSAQASEMIGVAVLALARRFTLSDLGSIPFAHPTFSEAIKEACLNALGRV